MVTMESRASALRWRTSGGHGPASLQGGFYDVKAHKPALGAASKD